MRSNTFRTREIIDFGGGSSEILHGRPFSNFMSQMLSIRGFIAMAVAVVIGGSVAMAQTYQMRSSVVSGGAVNSSGGSYAVKGTIGQPVIGPISGATYHAYQGFWYTLGPADALSSPSVDITVFLEGAYQDGSPPMTSVLSGTAGSDVVIPTVHPYSVAPWGVPVFSPELASTYFDDKDDAVDWVLVRARESTGTTVMAEAVGLLLDDGTVVDPVTLSDLELDGLINLGDQYYIEVIHRNHLAVMSANTTDFLTSPTAWDFTAELSGGGAPHFGASGQKQMSVDPDPLVYAMYTGDADVDGNVFPSDLVDYWMVQSGLSGYKEADFDLDANVFPSDLILWIANSGVGSAVP